MIALALLVVIVLVLGGGAPVWPYSRGWGWYPAGSLVGILLLALLVVLLFGWH